MSKMLEIYSESFRQVEGIRRARRAAGKHHNSSYHFGVFHAACASLVGDSNFEHFFGNIIGQS